MAALTIVLERGKPKRTGRRQACGAGRKDSRGCGAPDMEWVRVVIAGSANPDGGEWRLVPFGHSINGGAAIDSTLVHKCPAYNAGSAPAPTPSAPVDLSPLQTEIARLDAKIDGLTTADGSVDDARIKAIEDEIDGLTTIGQTIASKIDGMVADVRRDVAALDKARDIRIDLTNSNNVTTIHDVGRQHRDFELILKMVLALGDSGYVFLTGEAGAGKTYIVEQIAAAIKLPYWSAVMHPLVAGTDFIGYKDANSRDVFPLPLRNVYGNGGVFAIDEVANASAEAATCINAATSNKVMGFIDGMIPRHPDCILIALDNTNGRGGDSIYIRGQLDGATLNRACYFPFEPDWSLLGDLIGDTITATAQRFSAPTAPRSDAECAGWAQYLVDISNIVKDEHILAVIGQRNIINGKKLLAAGLPQSLVEFATVWQHMSEQDIATVQDVLKSNGRTWKCRP